MNQQVFFGKSSIDFLSSEINKLTSRKVFLITQMELFSVCGVKEIMQEILDNLNVEYFSDFKENPKWQDVQKGLNRLRDSKADIIIAIGGGSVLDMAKLIRFFYSYSGSPTGKIFSKQRDLLPLFALPTTSGTGAEATHFAVCYVDGLKYSIEHEDILPNYAIIYPAFTYGNPKYLTACTVFDAFAQSIESYWSVNATKESEEYSIKALRLLYSNIREITNNPTTKNRDAVAEGAYLAGKAINIAKTTAPHAFSYQFTSKCGYPHGHAVALTFPFFLDLNLNASPQHLQSTIDYDYYQNKMNTLKSILNVDKGGEYGMMVNLINDMGLVFHGWNNQDVKQMLSCVNTQRLDNNPVIIDDKVIKALNELLKNE